MGLEFLSDPVFLFIVSVFIFVIAFFYWFEKREKERMLEERLKRLEEKQEEANQNKS